MEVLLRSRRTWRSFKSFLADSHVSENFTLSMALPWKSLSTEETFRPVSCTSLWRLLSVRLMSESESVSLRLPPVEPLSSDGQVGGFEWTCVLTRCKTSRSADNSVSNSTSSAGAALPLSARKPTMFTICVPTVSRVTMLAVTESGSAIARFQSPLIRKKSVPRANYIRSHGRKKYGTNLGKSQTQDCAAQPYLAPSSPIDASALRTRFRTSLLQVPVDNISAQNAVTPNSTSHCIIA